MQTNVTEKDLRQWLRSVWSKGKGGVGVQWVEPTSGSSVGFPDALLPVWPALLPIELKVARRNAFEYFQCDVRPVQRRFHIMMTDSDIFCSFLIAEGEKKSFSVWLSHSSYEPWTNHECPGEVMIATNQTVNASISRMQFVSEILKLMNKHNQVLLQVPGERS